MNCIQCGEELATHIMDCPQCGNSAPKRYKNGLGAPPPPPPPIDPRLLGGSKKSNTQKSTEQIEELSAGQVQFLAKFKDIPLSEEMIDYYNGIVYYQSLVGGDVKKFVRYLENKGLIQSHDTSAASWICSDNGRQVSDKAIIDARAKPANIINFVKTLPTSEMLKVATQLKNDGNISAAILVLKEAEKKALDYDESLGVEFFIKIASYLQIQGDFDEAWGILNQLLSSSYPTQIQEKASTSLANSKIYKAMCQLLQREGRGRMAIAFGAASIVAEAECYYLQSIDKDSPKDLREEQMEAFIRLSKDAYVLSKVKRIAKKEVDDRALEKVTKYLSELLARPTAIKYDQLIAEVDALTRTEIQQKH